MDESNYFVEVSVEELGKYEDVPTAEVETPGVGLGPSTLSKQPIPGIYNSLYQELILKCNPARFLNPYDPKKASIANELFSQIRDCKSDEGSLRRLRQRAVDELGISISTEKLYKELLSKCNPQLFTGVNYNKELFDIANQIYQNVLANADDFKALEETKRSAYKIYEWHAAKNPSNSPTPPNFGELIAYITLVGLISAIVLAFILLVFSLVRSFNDV